MNIMKKTTIILSEAEVQDIIAKYLSELGHSVKRQDVDLKVGTRLEGEYPYECSRPYFKNCIVDVNQDA